MTLSRFWFALALCIASHVYATSAAEYGTTFDSVAQPGTKLRYVSDSGVCETTPGVHQMSGYIDIAENQHIWFWFFEARSNPETAPFTLWLNGGPGCSSMVGLFQENGPCTVAPDGQTTLYNPYSWNNLSNMIYIDQPIGTGFSYGVDTVNSTWAAAPPVWQAFQILFESEAFSKYQSREFILATESYGGHYGPEFVTHFDQQNALVRGGEIQGVEIVVSALMINNGWFDPLIQYKSYLTFATYAPGYGQLQNDSVLQEMRYHWDKAGGCKDQEEACYAAGNSSKSNDICKTADAYCNDKMFDPGVGDRDSYDLRQNASALFPFEYYLNYLANTTIVKKIGAKSTYGECPDPPYELFVKTGDDARTLLPQLAALVDSKLKILIWAGDADINCNWLGGWASMQAMDWYGQDKLSCTQFTNLTMDGKAVGQYVNVDNFSFARIFAAGHEVPAFQPAVALEIFRQVIAKQQLHSI
ncbi:hypothetical protein APHAL10511_003085 [Amanita phalloides]|nr:hypothetical protein APHAL10511_003085 [Amanita phalloides]